MRRYITVMILSLLCISAFADVTPPTYVFMAPPRQGPVAGAAIYGRIAKFLTKATGASFTFHYVNNWLTYTEAVRTNQADLYFDGPAFIGWRIARWHDAAAVALKGQLNLVLVGKAHNQDVTQVSDLIGRGVCAFSPPNLGTLTLESWFQNPERKPYIVVIHSFPEGMRDIITGKCVGMMEPVPVFKRMSAKFPGLIRIIHKAALMPNQGFSIGARVPPALRQKIIAALLSPAGLEATKPLRDMFGHKGLVATPDSLYLPYRKLLNVMVGF
ncbi:MAG TPA: PhnD/SsuA/transferrin family substrate-binding protein [Acidiferrobacter sp.]|nr:PhnD/SsuA/transferrin family substrate-binding protein [Acidiferrobacter sp.]